jgi:hypothetical protein
MHSTDHPNAEAWIQIPPNGRRCTVTGLSHARFYRLIASSGGAIRTVSLREPGQNRATRSVDPKSLLIYLDKLADEQRQQERPIQLGSDGKYPPNQRRVESWPRKGMETLLPSGDKEGGGSAYRSLAGQWRTDLGYGWDVSGKNNLLMQSVSLEGLQDNAAKANGAGRATLWNNQLGDLLGDTHQYLMFQHTAQRSFVSRWKVGSHIFRIHKESRIVRPFQSANHIEGFGAENWQSLDMEKAFSDVERVVGYTDHKGEMTDPAKIKTLARWLALHLVRTRRHRDVALANGRDYRQAVDLFESRLLTFHTFFHDHLDPVFITADNPVVLMGSELPGQHEWIVAPLSPKRCIYAVSGDRIPFEAGHVGVRPSTINQWVFNQATEHCLSFDRSLHLP